ncbi:magnesium chelatase subunit D [Hydrogenophaga crocea]|nr:magnesium chelatase subunit D [Hydrogenophaga crocea]
MNAAADAATAAALMAVDPLGLGGVWLRAAAGPERDDWLAQLRGGLPAGRAWRRVPLHIRDAELLGGLDLAASLREGRAIARDGLLLQAHAGVLLLPSVQRQAPHVLAHLHRVLDTGELPLEREGHAGARALSLAVVALDDRADDEDPQAGPCAPGLADRLALHIELGAAGLPAGTPWPPEAVAVARERLPAVAVPEALLRELCASAQALGVASLRAPLQALRVARAAAALDGAVVVHTRHAALALAWVLLPRATQWPAPEAKAETETETETEAAQAPSPEPHAREPHAPEAANVSPPDSPGIAADDPTDPAPEPAEALFDAARASLPAGLLAALAQRLAPAPGRGGARSATGRGGPAQRLSARGRPLGARRGRPDGLQRLSLIDTLRAAAPWQALRRREAPAAAAGPRVHVRPDDLHVTRRRQTPQATTLFVVDASGSSALHRLAEAKGAVELLLADCYVRRDRVALLAFRGTGAELLLPPTRSLARAKRSLAGLPGGGGTPLATALAQAGELLGALQRRGETPQLVLLTDGRANIAADGSPGRERAGSDALCAARRLRGCGAAALLIDTSPMPHPHARGVADAMGARYLPLPHAGAGELSRAVRGARPAAAALA